MVVIYDFEKGTLGESYIYAYDEFDGLNMITPEGIRKPLYSKVVSNGTKKAPKNPDTMLYGVQSTELVDGIKIGLINLMISLKMSECEQVSDGILTLEERELGRRYNCSFPPPRPETRRPLYLRAPELGPAYGMRINDYALFGYKVPKSTICSETLCPAWSWSFAERRLG